MSPQGGICLPEEKDFEAALVTAGIVLLVVINASLSAGTTSFREVLVGGYRCHRIE